jgi:uncharacterized membrane protein
MTLDPLLSAPLAIQLHTYAASGAFLLGIVQLARLKGTMQHRTLGYIWVALMSVVAASAFWIHELKVWGDWSPIHLLAIFTLVMLPLGVHAARRHNERRHKLTMLSMFAGALLVAGLFTFAPGRLMHQVVFGG